MSNISIFKIDPTLFLSKRGSKIELDTSVPAEMPTQFNKHTTKANVLGTSLSNFGFKTLGVQPMYRLHHS